MYEIIPSHRIFPIIISASHHMSTQDQVTILRLERSLSPDTIITLILIFGFLHLWENLFIWLNVFHHSVPEDLWYQYIWIKLCTTLVLLKFPSQIVNATVVKL